MPVHPWMYNGSSYPQSPYYNPWYPGGYMQAGPSRGDRAYSPSVAPTTASTPASVSVPASPRLQLPPYNPNVANTRDVNEHEPTHHEPPSQATTAVPRRSKKATPAASADDGRLWPCLVTGCTKVFSHLNRIQHMDLHYPRFCCPLPACDFVANRKVKIKEHLNRHHPREDVDGKEFLGEDYFVDPERRMQGWLYDVSGLDVPAPDDPIRRSFRRFSRIECEDPNWERFCKVMDGKAVPGRSPDDEFDADE